MVKVVAGVLTGSIAILTEAIHSAIDLLASFVALVSVRKAEVPADEDHPYGHEKAENVAAGAEAMLILVGAAIIGYEAVRRLGCELRDRAPRHRHRGDRASRRSPTSSSPAYLSRRARRARLAGARG